MFKLASGLFVAGIALAPFAGVNINRDRLVAAAHAPDIYRVVASSGDNCIMMLHADSGTMNRSVSPQADCASMDTRIDAIRKWDANPDGTVSLRDFSNKEVVRLEVSGPNSFKSVESENLQLSVRREN